MFGRVVVAGAGVAGIAAAKALAPAADEVVVVDRDPILSDPDRRPGVPQARQLHNILAMAQRSLAELFPGIVESLDAAGAASATVSTDTVVHELGVRMPERDLGFELRCLDRLTVERVMRAHLESTVNVRFLEGTRVSGIEADADAVTAVRLVAGAGEKRLDADIVVDATGARALGRQWLGELGRPVPETRRVEVGQWYVTCRFERPDDLAGSSRFWMVFPTPPRTGGALLSPIGDREWYASVSGGRSDTPPETVEAFLEHAAALDDPMIADVLRAATPIGQPTRFVKTESVWHRYDQLDAPLAGLLPLGDAFASLNPLYGQGISVTAWAASELARVARNGGADDLDRLTTDYLAAAGGCIQRAWDLGRLVVADDDEPDLRRLKFVADAVADDPAVHETYVRVWHLLDPLDALPEEREGAA